MKKIKLLCLPFAGGNKYSYKRFLDAVPGNIEIIALDVPGRGARMDEPLLTDIHDMSNDLFARIRPWLDHSYAIYGHSMGTLLGFLITKKILQNHLPAPQHLFFTGSIAPSKRENRESLHALPQEQFIQKLDELGGCPKELLENNVLLEFFEPILRADFKAVESYRYNNSVPFDIPLTLITGTEEDIKKEDALAWREETTLPLEWMQLPGGHFFIYQHTNAIIEIIEQRLIKA